jgi:hypothetical protein
MDGRVLNSKGIHVAVVNGAGIFDINGRKLYNLKDSKIYRLTGELVGHLSKSPGAEQRLDRANDKLFPVGSGR